MKEFRQTTVFFLALIVLWSILALNGFHRNYEARNYKEHEFTTVEGEIASAERWGDDGFIYVKLESYGDVEFEITYEKGISLKTLNELQESKEHVTFIVSEESYRQYKELEMLEILAFSSDEQVFWNLHQYYEEQERSSKIQIVVCTVGTIGLICSYFYLRKQFIIIKRRSNSIYKCFR